MNVNIDILERAIAAAQHAANELRETEDGGTCNLDMVAVNLGSYTQKRRNELAELDWRVEPVGEKGWAGYWFVHFDLSGQGNRRTRMAEAAKKVLRQHHFDACVYYQID